VTGITPHTSNKVTFEMAMTDGREGTPDMLKLLLIATFTLGTFALAQAEDIQGNSQSANNDWYNQHLSAQVQQFEQVNQAVAAELAIDQSAKPPSMASDSGSQNASDDWYNQVLSKEVDLFTRQKAFATSTAGQ
jgi:hypothetical protein